MANDLLNLSNTIMIDNDTYAINANKAEYSKSAEKTENALTIELSQGDSPNKEISFNGSTKEEVSIVPAGGGIFTGRVKNTSYTDTDIDISNGENYKNYKDDLATIDVVKKITEQITEGIIGLPLGSWNGQTLTINEIKGTEEAVAKIAIIIGEKEKFNDFKDWVPEEPAKKPENYLYICSDSASDSALVYVKTDGNEVQTIGEKAEIAETAETAKTAENLVWKDENEDVIEYTAKDLKNTLDSLNTKIINELENNISSNARSIKTNTESIKAINTTLKNCYQSGNPKNNSDPPKITMSKDSPSANFGNLGDIWIKYSDSNTGTV